MHVVAYFVLYFKKENALANPNLCSNNCMQLAIMFDLEKALLEMHELQVALCHPVSNVVPQYHNR